jgi:hypothetical protein
MAGFDDFRQQTKKLTTGKNATGATSHAVEGARALLAG